MSRLTMKLDEPIKTKYLNYEYNRIPDYDIVRGNFGRISDDMIFNKLGRLEDIEDELGCPLDVVFKAISQNHIYIQMFDRNEKGEIYEPHKLVMYKQENVVLSRTKNHQPKDVWCLSFWGGWNDLWVACVYLSDYKKTWFLKGDLSE